MIDIKQVIPEERIEGKRLGRHIRHDARSAQYPVRKVNTILSQFWRASNDEALDQASVGACTGFATAQALNCLGKAIDNAGAYDIYSLATRLDPFDGQWPPEDTGSSGLAAVKAARQLGYLKGWTNAFGLDDVLHALQSGPGILGCTWYGGCDDPSLGTGLVSPTGIVRGGHETAIVGLEIGYGRIILRNSWGPGYGVTCQGQSGYFRLSYAEFAALLDLTGDAIFLEV